MEIMVTGLQDRRRSSCRENYRRKVLCNAAIGCGWTVPRAIHTSAGDITTCGERGKIRLFRRDATPRSRTHVAHSQSWGGPPRIQILEHTAKAAFVADVAFAISTMNAGLTLRLYH